MDPVSTSVLGWLTGQAKTAGQEKLARWLASDKQRSTLRKIITASIGPAVAEVANSDDREMITSTPPTTRVRSRRRATDRQATPPGHPGWR